MPSLKTSLGLVALLGAGTLPLEGQARQLPALPELEARARTDSLDATASYDLSLGYFRAKRPDDEERALRRAVAIDPRYAPAYLSLSYLPFQRRPKLWREVRKSKVPPEWRAAVEESERLVNRAFLIDPLVDLRVVGAEPPREDLVSIPDYGSATTDFLLQLGIGAFGAARYELSHSALQLWVDRAYAGQPRDSLPDFLFWYRGLAAAHLKVHRIALADFETLFARAQQHELTDTLIQVPLRTNDYRYVLAVLHDAAGKPADERRHPERVPPEIRYYRGLAASSMDLHTVAIRDVEALLKRSLAADTGASLAVAPIRTNELRYLLAFVHHRAGRLERARELYREAGEYDFGLYMAHVQLAGILVEAGQFDSAVVEREAAANSNPDDSSVQVDLALTLTQAGRDSDPLRRCGARPI